MHGLAEGCEGLPPVHVLQARPSHCVKGRNPLVSSDKSCLQVFEDLDFTLMEMNPFTLDHEGSPFPLDMRGELDDTAAFKSLKKWGDVEFPLPFGRTMTAAEEYVHTLDGNTGPPALPLQASTARGFLLIWPITCLACTPLRRQFAMRLHPMECSDHAYRV